METESRTGAARGWGEGRGSYYLMGMEIRKTKRALEMGVVMAA